jgi:hypothetical protein
MCKEINAASLMRGPNIDEQKDINSASTRKAPNRARVLQSLLLLGGMFATSSALAVGALAVSTTNGFWYWYSVNYADLQEAKAVALSGCMKVAANCQIQGAYSKTNVAVSQNANGGWWWAYSPSASGASDLALKFCEQNSQAGSCRVLETWTDNVAGWMGSEVSTVHDGRIGRSFSQTVNGYSFSANENGDRQHATVTATISGGGTASNNIFIWANVPGMGIYCEMGNGDWTQDCSIPYRSNSILPQTASIVSRMNISDATFNNVDIYAGIGSSITDAL